MSMARLKGSGLLDRVRTLIRLESTRGRTAETPRQLRKDRTNETIFKRITDELKASGSPGLSKYDRKLLRDAINTERLEQNQLSRFITGASPNPVKFKGKRPAAPLYDVEVIVVRDAGGGKQIRGRGYIRSASSVDDGYLLDRIRESDEALGGMSMPPPPPPSGVPHAGKYFEPIKVIVLDAILKEQTAWEDL